MPPKISVITVCRNEAGRIEQTCESIAKQTFQNFEWLVLDGGSTDGTLEILEKYRSRFDFFRSHSDDGIYSAMNEGIQNASGEYCFFLNGGDWLISETIFEQIVPHLSENMDLIIGGIRVVYSSGSIVDFLVPKWDYWRSFKYCPPHQASFYRTDALKKKSLYNTHFRILADYELFLRFRLEGNSIATAPILVSFFRLGGLSSTDPRSDSEKRTIKQHYYGYAYWPLYLLLRLNEEILRLLGKGQHQ